MGAIINSIGPFQIPTYDSSPRMFERNQFPYNESSPKPLLTQEIAMRELERHRNGAPHQYGAYVARIEYTLSKTVFNNPFILSQHLHHAAHITVHENPHDSTLILLTFPHITLSAGFLTVNISYAHSISII